MTDHPSARQRLLDAMRNRTCFCGADSCQTPEPLIDAYAHELAEQQRAFLRSKGTVWTGSIGQVINHIDPEAQR
ncbi:hypothetical protein [Streptomyces sp. NBC_01373]|uniref:hypothetical protein n=1 Tax=Streptomyces sp. NBC_01373 TaxID=2903843 RepID=UPI00225B174E|nr:hypothetical protein [Streptomyces sp. NBC_01373]MCX4697031.1 hypothetical protein [Streptomyces sp. NBC_01373]MCX4707044.1 hypothetical protein [Streptomyces sp. NBC_01373]